MFGQREELMREEEVDRSKGRFVFASGGSSGVALIASIRNPTSGKASGRLPLTDLYLFLTNARRRTGGAFISTRLSFKPELQPCT